MQFIRHQPERDHNWRAWLVTAGASGGSSAGRATTGARTAMSQGMGALRAATRPRDPRADIEPRIELQEALDALKELRPRLRRIAFLRGVGLSYDEIGRLTGDSRTRVGQLVRRANEALWTCAQKRQERETPAPPRVARLRALRTRTAVVADERDRAAAEGRDTAVTHVLLWRRAAVALDDYRRRRGEFAARALETCPTIRDLASMHSAAWRAVGRYRDEVGRARERPPMSASVSSLQPPAHLLWPWRLTPTTSRPSRSGWSSCCASSRTPPPLRRRGDAARASESSATGFTRARASSARCGSATAPRRGCASISSRRAPRFAALGALDQPPPDTPPRRRRGRPRKQAPPTGVRLIQGRTGR